MNDQTFADEFKAAADLIAYADPAADPLVIADDDFAKLNLYRYQTSLDRTMPALTIQAVTDKVYRSKAGFYKIKLIVESTATGDDEAANPDNHRARVAIVEQRFIEEKADRIGIINNRGKVFINDYGQIGALISENIKDESGQKLRTTLTLRLAGRIV